MPFYNLRIVSTHVTQSEVCSGDIEALARFSQLVGFDLTFEGDGPSDFLMAKRHEPLGWVKPAIPVWRKEPRIATSDSRH